MVHSDALRMCQVYALPSELWRSFAKPVGSILAQPFNLKCRSFALCTMWVISYTIQCLLTQFIPGSILSLSCNPVQHHLWCLFRYSMLSGCPCQESIRPQLAKLAAPELLPGMRVPTWRQNIPHVFETYSHWREQFTPARRSHSSEEHNSCQDPSNPTYGLHLRMSTHSKM